MEEDRPRPRSQSELALKAWLNMQASDETLSNWPVYYEIVNNLEATVRKEAEARGNTIL